MRTYRCIIILMTIVVLLTTGCLYPEERLTGGMEALPTHVENVQAAVDRYVEKQSVLPIKTTDENTPLYQKYVIDFQRLIPVYISDPPPSSFEKGGSFMYVLVDVEKNPTVKLFDLRVSDVIRTVQQEVNAFTEKHGRNPRGMEIAPGVFELNEELLSHADTKVPSPYSPELKLPLVMDAKGTVYVDYRMELMRMIQEKGEPPSPTGDIRRLLVESSLFVPAHSLPYKYENGEVVFAVDERT